MAAAMLAVGLVIGTFLPFGGERVVPMPSPVVPTPSPEASLTSGSGLDGYTETTFPAVFSLGATRPPRRTWPSRPTGRSGR